jgi:quercetin dioxygenase-like cupin family protein
MNDQEEQMSNNYFPDIRTKAVFSTKGPKPQFLIETPQFKALVVGLEAGGQIPVHPGEAAAYHFLEGEGQMIVDEETFEVKPGVTVVAPSGAKRGVNAKTRLVFLGAKGER